MIKTIITKAREHIKLFFLISILILLIFFDAALILADRFIGTERGIVFNFKLSDILLYSNLTVIGVVCLIFLMVFLIKYSKVIKNLLRNLAISVIAFVIVIFLVELVCYFAMKIRDRSEPYTFDSSSDGLWRGDSLLGYGLNSDTTGYYNKYLIDRVKQDTSLIYSTTVITDSIGNRLIDVPGIQNRKKYALFFGCSFTFGMGVENNQNLPYYFANYDTSYCVYNFGLGGYGPQNTLVQLGYTDIKKHIKQDSGICFYTYMGGHPGRVIGDLRIVTTFGKSLPYFGYKQSKLYRFGTFYHNRWLTTNLYLLFGKSNFIKYFNINIPFNEKPKHYRLTCDILYHSYLEYKRKFQNDNFYVILYPSFSYLKDYLKEYDIKVIDCGSLFDKEEQRYYVSLYDKHPSALAYRVLAKHIIDTINKLN